MKTNILLVDAVTNKFVIDKSIDLFLIPRKDESFIYQNKLGETSIYTVTDVLYSEESINLMLSKWEENIQNIYITQFEDSIL